MARTETYIIFFTFLMILLEFAGIGIIGGALFTSLGFSDSNTIQDSLDTGVDFKSTNFFQRIFGSAGSAIVGILIITLTGIIVGVIARIQPENFIILPFIVLSLVLFGDVAIGILKQIGSYPLFMSATIFFIFFGLSIGFLISLVSFFRGNN